MTDTLQLSPCPFCGGEVKFVPGNPVLAEPVHRIECPGCRIELCFPITVIYGPSNRELLMTAWNRRAEGPWNSENVKDYLRLCREEKERNREMSELQTEIAALNRTIADLKCKDVPVKQP